MYPRNQILSCIIILLCFAKGIQAQTSWKGTTSTNWTTASNWTAGVPTSTTDAILGDANFTGANQPTVNTAGSCKSLTLGGAVSTTLTLTKNLTVSGNVLINTNATVTHPKSTLSISGIWTNNGVYSNTNVNANVIFNGVTQSINGSATTTFRKITVSAGSTLTLNTGFTVSGSSSLLTVTGIINPGSSTTYLITASAITVNSGGKLLVYASTFAGNYSVTPTLMAGSIVEYASSSIAQTVSISLTYATLNITGSTVKTLAGNLPSLLSSASTEGNIFVIAGTLDLVGYTANRGTSVAGGTLKVSNGATFKIGGTGSFPSNYATKTIQIASIIEYYGTNQTVSAETYGNLNFSSSSGAATKTLPVTAFTIEGNFNSSIGSGTSVSYTAGNAITINGTATIGSSTTFNGASYTHSIANNWINNGTFTGATSTVTVSGVNAVISGSGTYNINNLILAASGITASATNLTLTGNFSATGTGQFTHNSGGTLIMSGTSKTISGTGITLDNLTISGSVTTASSLIITGNFSVSGSFSASTGTVTMNGTTKSFSGAGTIAFYNFYVSGSITTAISFSAAGTLDVSGSFSASAGTATFTGTSAMNGIANLYNAVLNGTSLRLSVNAVMGIANTFTITSGTLDVTTSFPNTVHYNGSGAQNVIGTTYDNLILSNGNTKTAAAAITVNRDLTIAASTTFNAASYSHQVNENWNNSGSFTASTSTVSFAGVTDGIITGATTFNILTVNKTAATNIVTLASNVSTPTLNMTTGSMKTGSNTITITTTRTGNGIILGNIQRTHSFTNGTAYAFEGPDNTITFSVFNLVTSVTVAVTSGSISDFPFNASVNRQYEINVTGTFTQAALRLHYEDAELNGNNESTIEHWKYNGSSWVSSGKTSNSTTLNYVEQTGLTALNNRWTCSYPQAVVQWNGSISSNWNTAANWTSVQGSPGTPPTSTDIVQIGNIAFTNQPTISNSASVKNIIFGSAQAATLTLTTGGSLTVAGNLTGTWAGDMTHTINVNDQSLTVNGDIILSDGTANHIINLNASGGTISIAGSLTQSGGAAVVITNAATLNIAGDYNYTSGTFTAGIGTVVYNGTVSQIIAPVTYNHLTVNKSAGIASFNAVTTIGGNLLVSAGELNNFSTTTINGNTTVNSGAMFKNYLYLHQKGNWTINSTYIVLGGSIFFDGTTDQYISASSFNNLNINKASGTAFLTGDAIVYGNLIITAGTLDLQTYACNRSSLGGYISIAAAANLYAGGNNNFPSNFEANTLSTTSNVYYNGTGTQTVAGITYGNLIVSNGGSNAKTLNTSVIVNGNLTINSGSSLHSGGFTIELYGNLINNATFTPSTGTVILQGASKTITGNTIFNRLTVNGSYTIANTDITLNGLLNVTSTGSFVAGTGTAVLNGDLINSGSLNSTGTTIFSGTVVQTLRLINALTSSSTGVVNFNGNVSPVFNSTSSPTFAILNINNTAGITPSTSWIIGTAMNVNSGGIFNGGISTHYFYGNFTNAGTVISTGSLIFLGSAAKTVNFGSSGFSSDGTINFSGSGLITIAGTPGNLKNVSITNTNSAGVTASSNWNLTGNFTISSNSVFHASTYSYTVAGNIESDGTLDGGTSTFTMSSTTGELSGSANTTFYHFTISGIVAAQSDFNVSGNYTNNGTYDGTLASLIMTGSTNASISGTTSPSSLSQLIVAKTSGATITMGVNLSDVLLLFIQSGTLFTSTYTITQDASGGFLLISDAATLKLGGTNSLPGFSGYSLDTNSNVEYAGGTQSIGNAATYGNLIFSAAGNKNAIVPFITLGNFTLSNGTFTSSVSVTHTIGGNWLMSGGTFTNTNITILLNGTVDQSINSIGAFKNLTINKASGLTTLASAVTVSTTLNLTAGKVSIGNYDFTIGNSGSITNANATNYIIATGTGTLAQQVVAGGSKTYPIGSSTAYTPATIALTAGSTTDIFNIRMLTSFYSQGTTGTALTSNAINATWMIAETVAGGSDASLTCQWPLSLELPGFDRAFSRVAHYISGAWEYGFSNLAASGSNPYTVTRSGITSFSPFGVSMMMTPLPATSIELSGKNNGNENLINWSTLTETNTAYFSVEASLNGIDFTEIEKAGAAGNSSSLRSYNFVHREINNQSYSYRIKQVDENGNFVYSKVIRLSAIAFRLASLYPNPVKNKTTISFSLKQTSLMTVVIRNASGQVVYNLKQLYNKGDHKTELDLSLLPAASYTLQLKDDSGSIQSIQFIKTN